MFVRVYVVHSHRRPTMAGGEEGASAATAPKEGLSQSLAFDEELDDMAYLKVPQGSGLLLGFTPPRWCLRTTCLIPLKCPLKRPEQKKKTVRNHEKLSLNVDPCALAPARLECWPAMSEAKSSSTPTGGSEDPDRKDASPLHSLP